MSQQDTELEMDETREPKDAAGLLALLDGADSGGSIRIESGIPYVIECGTNYRGKAGGYRRETRSVEWIVDKDRHVLKPVWNDFWTEIAPGIETRSLSRITRSDFEERSLEQAVRISHEACPVFLRMLRASDYEDYENSQYSTSYERYYWRGFKGE